MNYLKHFGSESEKYQQYRPDYPAALYDFLSKLLSHHDLAWDCATGNGQAALILSQKFQRVIASDINATQISVAKSVANIFYYAWPADKTHLADKSVDLITIAQALHWFANEKFYLEVQRVAKKEAYIAAWCYSLGSINPEVDKIIRYLYDDILGDVYWPEERRLIDKHYQTILFPFEKVVTPEFKTAKSFNLQELIGYLNTWSAVKEYQKQRSSNPVELILPALDKVWQDGSVQKVMEWPLHLRVGKI